VNRTSLNDIDVSNLTKYSVSQPADSDSLLGRGQLVL
jgi:hypothetical protein